MPEKVVIVGLGYVGLPLACLSAKKGFRTTGLDISRKIVDATNAGKSHIKDKELEKNTALRTELASNITDKTCLKHYEHIFRRAVPAISRLEGNICTECGTKVLPQSINMLKVGQQMQYCSRCKRILYIESLVFANDTDCPSCEG